MKKARSFFNKLLVLTLAALLVCQPLHIVKAAEETDFVILEGAEENYTYEDGILQITSGSVKVANRKETASDERIVISGVPWSRWPACTSIRHRERLWK